MRRFLSVFTQHLPSPPSSPGPFSQFWEKGSRTQASTFTPASRVIPGRHTTRCRRPAHQHRCSDGPALGSCAGAGSAKKARVVRGVARRPLIPDPDELRPSGFRINSLPSQAARLPLAFARERACARRPDREASRSRITGMTRAEGERSPRDNVRRTKWPMTKTPAAGRSPSGSHARAAAPPTTKRERRRSLSAGTGRPSRSCARSRGPSRAC